MIKQYRVVGAVSVCGGEVFVSVILREQVYTALTRAKKLETVSAAGTDCLQFTVFYCMVFQLLHVFVNACV